MNKSKFKIATYNIHKDEGDFPRRISPISSIIGDVDIICFQEDYENESFSSSVVINEKLNLNRISTITRKKQRDGIVSSSNLTILSKYPIKLLDEVYFKKAKDEERAFQICEVKIGELKVIISNTHLCHLSSERRLKHTKKILSKLKEYKGDIFLFCGDLNAKPDSKEIKKISKKYSSKNIEATYEDGSILDYIFIKSDHDLEVDSITIPSIFSDHYCLINKIILK